MTEKDYSRKSLYFGFEIIDIFEKIAQSYLIAEPKVT